MKQPRINQQHKTTSFISPATGWVALVFAVSVFYINQRCSEEHCIRGVRSLNLLDSYSVPDSEILTSAAGMTRDLKKLIDIYYLYTSVWFLKIGNGCIYVLATPAPVEVGKFLPESTSLLRI